ncbi:MAG TPA: hypothetical protein VEM15_11815 [Thermodesulfobacteriota bacterium]|nr:hypothetical protein [Thermodesulfobacteriota bacterium]
MATRKLTWILFGILVISVWVLGSAIQARTETLKYKVYTYAVKQESSPISDVEGHSLGFAVRSGFYVFENGEVATVNQVTTAEEVKGGSSILLYTTITFPDGSTIISRSQGTFGGGVPGFPASVGFKTEIIKGTGRFEGIKGTASSKAKFIPAEKGEVGPKAVGEGTYTYTLPSK